jgi:hypothetical protein
MHLFLYDFFRAFQATTEFLTVLADFPLVMGGIVDPLEFFTQW